MSMTKKGVVSAIKEKQRLKKVATKPVAEVKDSYIWPVELNSGDLPSLKGKKVGDKVHFSAEGKINAIMKGDRFSVVVNKIG